jgi:hypothetical protein
MEYVSTPRRFGKQSDPRIKASVLALSETTRQPHLTMAKVKQIPQS